MNALNVFLVLWSLAWLYWCFTDLWWSNRNMRGLYGFLAALNVWVIVMNTVLR